MQIQQAVSAVQNKEGLVVLSTLLNEFKAYSLSCRLHHSQLYHSKMVDLESTFERENIQRKQRTKADRTNTSTKNKTSGHGYSEICRSNTHRLTMRSSPLAVRLSHC